MSILNPQHYERRFYHTETVEPIKSKPASRSPKIRFSRKRLQQREVEK